MLITGTKNYTKEKLNHGLIQRSHLHRMLLKMVLILGVLFRSNTKCDRFKNKTKFKKNSAVPLADTIRVISIVVILKWQKCKGSSLYLSK